MGRITLNFHPDRISRAGSSVAAGLLAEGRYQSQWVTGISSGSRSAVRAGEREGWERALFDDVYGGADAAVTEFPVYGSFDLLFDEHGGSPSFGSSFVVLRRHVLDRTSLCVGDSVSTPRDVGTADAPWSVLAALAEQAAQQKLLNRQLGLEALVSVLDGSYRANRAFRVLDGYIEAQVHGGVSLEQDVEAIVVDPSFRGTEVEVDLSSAAHRFGFELKWHRGSELHVDAVPADFRGPTMPDLARKLAGADGTLTAHLIGSRAAQIPYAEPVPTGDPPESDLQQLKYLWHTLVAHGHDAL